MTRLYFLLVLGLLGCTLATHNLSQYGAQLGLALAAISVPVTARSFSQIWSIWQRRNFGLGGMCLIALFPIMAPWLLILESREVHCKYVRPLRRLGILGPLTDAVVVCGWYHLGGGWLLGIPAFIVLVIVRLAALRLWGRAKSHAGIA